VHRRSGGRAETYAGGSRLSVRVNSLQNLTTVFNSTSFSVLFHCIFKRFSGRRLMSVQNVRLVAQSDNVAVFSSFTAVLLLVCLK